MCRFLNCFWELVFGFMMFECGRWCGWWGFIVFLVLILMWLKWVLSFMIFLCILMIGWVIWKLWVVLKWVILFSVDFEWLGLMGGLFGLRVDLIFSMIVRVILWCCKVLCRMLLLMRDDGGKVLGLWWLIKYYG